MSALTNKEAGLVARLRQEPRSRLMAMYAAAAEAVECLGALAESGLNPVTAVLDGASRVEEWAHFPPGDAVDPDTHSRYYYHCHAAEERAAGEYGHFHTFMQPAEPSAATQPGGPASRAAAEDARPIVHLVGVSTDASGGLIRLFTTNRWVTGEVWCAADEVVGMLDGFRMTKPELLQHVNRWIGAVVAMFRPQIEDLIRHRDAALGRHRAAHPGADALEDRALQVISQMPVDLVAQIGAIETALSRAGAPCGATRPRPRSPR